MKETKVLQVRLDKEIHRRLRVAAAMQGISVREYVENLLGTVLKGKEVAHV